MEEKRNMCGWKENSKSQQWCFKVVAVEREMKGRIKRKSGR